MFIKFSLLIGLKSNKFVLHSFRETLFALSQSTNNFNLLLITADITEGFLLSYNKLVSSGKWWTMNFARALVRSLL